MATQTNNIILLEKDIASPLRGQQRSIDAADDIVLSPTSVAISPSGAASVNSTGSAIGIGNVSATGAISIGTAGNRLITLGNATNTSAFTVNAGSGGVLISTNATAGTISIGTDDGTGLIKIGGGAANRSTQIGGTTGISTLSLQSGTGGVSIGTSSAGSRAITLGHATNSGILTLNAGTGGITLSVNGTSGPIALTSSSTGTIDIANDAGTGTVSIVGGSATSARTVNIATGGTAAKTLTLGSTTLTSTSTLQAGTGGIVISTSSTTGNITIQNTSTGLINIGNDSGTGAISIGSSSGARAISIGSSTGGSPGTISIGTWSSATSGTGQTINIGQSTQAGNIIDARSTTINIAAASAGFHAKSVNIGGTINLGNDTQTGTISIASSTGARQVDVGTGAVAQTLNFGTGAGVKTISLGSTNTTSASTLQSGTGAMTLNAGGIFDVNAVGAVTIDSSTTTISIGSDAVNQAINIGTAGDRIISIGRSDTQQYVELRPGRRAIVLGSGSAGGTHGMGYFMSNRTGSSQTDGVLIAFKESPTADQVNAQFVLASAASGSAASIRKVNGVLSNFSSVSDGAAGIVSTMAGAFTPVKFVSVPAGSVDIGKPVYLSTTAGQATLTAPSGSGETVFRIGYLSRGVADANGNWFIQYQPQFIADIP